MKFSSRLMIPQLKIHPHDKENVNNQTKVQQGRTQLARRILNPKNENL